MGLIRMAKGVPIAIVLSVILVASIALSPIPVQASSKTVNGNGWSVTLATDADNYTLGQTVTVTLTFSGEFNGTILLIATNATGKEVYGDTKNVEQVTSVVFRFTLEDRYGVGEYTVKASVRGSIKADDRVQSVTVTADKLVVTFQVQQPPPPSNSIVVQGLVVDENNKPVPHALVYVPGTSIRAFTDNNGLFTLYFGAPGTYTLRLEKNDYYPETYTIRVNATANSILQLRLTTLAYQITLLREEVASLKALLQQVNSTLVLYGASIDALNKTLTSVTEQFSVKIDTLSNLLNATQAKILALNATILSLREELNNYALKDYVESIAENLTSTITSLNGSLAALRAEVASLAENLTSKISALVDSINKINNAISMLNNNLQNLQDAHKSLENRVASNENKLNDLQGGLSALQDTLNNVSSSLKRQVDSASLYGIIGIVSGIVGIVLAAIAILLVYRRLT